MRLKLREDSILRRPWLAASIAVSLVCAALVMILFDYEDGELSCLWSMQLLDCIFRKTDLEFYRYSEQCLSYYCCDKTILVMLPVSLWNLPCWLLHEITGNELFVKFGAVIWMKIGYLLCVLLMARECSKIIKKVKPDADHLLAYPLILGSFDIIDSTMYACQDEIIYLLMLVIALRKLIEDDMKLFLLFSVIAVSLNPEMIIPVALMAILREKKIVRAIAMIFITYIPSALFALVYGSNEAYAGASWIGRAGGMMSELFTTDIGLSQKEGNVSLFLVVLCVLLFYVLIKRKEGAETLDLIWVTGVTMTGMTLLSSGSFLNYFYRSFLYVPFLVTVIMTSKKNVHMNLILYGLYSWSRGWLCILTDKLQNMASRYLTINNEFTRRVYDKSLIVTPSSFAGWKIPLLGNYGVFSAVCLSLAVIIFYINFGKNRDRVYPSVRPKKDTIVFLTGLFLPAMICLFAIAMAGSDVYDKTIQFGSMHADIYSEDVLNYDRREEDGLIIFAHNLVYEDNICLMNGEDKGGCRYLYEEGSSFGPYLDLFPGQYRIVVEGSGLEGVYYDCVYNDSGEIITVPAEVERVSGRRIVYTMYVDRYTENVEMRFINYSSNEVLLDTIRIRQI